MHGPDVEPPERKSPRNVCECGADVEAREAAEQCEHCRERRQMRDTEFAFHDMQDAFADFHDDEAVEPALRFIGICFENLTDDQRHAAGALIYERFKAWLPDSPGKKESHV